jgi:hypothetical protein
LNALEELLDRDEFIKYKEQISKYIKTVKEQKDCCDLVKNRLEKDIDYTGTEGKNIFR